MYDKEGVKINLGDYVLSHPRWIDGIAKQKAIVGRIDKWKIIILFYSNGMPVPFAASPALIKILDDREVNEQERVSLRAAKRMFDDITSCLVAV